MEECKIAGNISEDSLEVGHMQAGKHILSLQDAAPLASLHKVARYFERGVWRLVVASSLCSRRRPRPGEGIAGIVGSDPGEGEWFGTDAHRARFPHQPCSPWCGPQTHSRDHAPPREPRQRQPGPGLRLGAAILHVRR